jgi:3-phosphoinositide dependent protein kinase-1
VVNNFLTKGELFNIISKYGPIKYEAVVFYIAELILGLEYMHSIGIIHRDLKPENIIFTDDLHLKITDFGTAKILDSNDSTKEPSMQTQKGTFCGTAQYVSPVSHFLNQ